MCIFIKVHNLLGSGTYSMNEIGAVSCTGHGESIMKICLAKHVITLMDTGLYSAQTALENSLELMSKRVNGAGGAICISAKGETAFHFTTERMAWAAVKNNTLNWGLNPGENEQEPVVMENN